MKFSKALMVVAFIVVRARMLQAQDNCPANATSLPLMCEVPIAATLIPSGGTAAGSIAKSNTLAINSSIAAQLTQLPVPSGTVGTVLLKGGEGGTGVVYNNLGPILTDRPDTVGRHRLYAGFSYQHFNFNSIDGISLSSFPFAYSFTPSVASNAISFGSQVSSIAFSLDQYVAQVTFGASTTTDVSVIVPINAVHLSSTTTAVTYTCPTQAVSPCTYGPPVTTVNPISGTASGIGDLQLSVKQMIHGQERSRSAVSVGGTLRLPTGDQNNYLGSGAYGFNGFVLFSYRARFSPHLKLGKQWNGPSPLVNTAGTNGEKNLPGGIQYDAGVDISIDRHFTVAADVLGNEFANTTSLQSGSITLTPVPSANSAPPALANTTSMNNTYTTTSVSGGFKYKPKRDLPLLFYGNVLYQLNNVGLRSSPVPLAGISYNFKFK